MTTATATYNTPASNNYQKNGNLFPQFNLITNILTDKIKNFVSLNGEETILEISGDLNTDYINNKEKFDFEISDIVKSNNSTKRSNYFLKTQKWVGHITEMKNSVIYARLDDLNDSTTHEIAEFDIEEVPYEDRELISVGAGFYFSIGQSYDTNGQLERKSLIRFQRAKPWDEADLEIILDEADNLSNKLKWE